MKALSDTTIKKVVIIGGGFAGLNLALQLAREKRYHIMVVDKNNYKLFTPLAYQVATCFLEISSICYPYRRLFRKHSNLQFRLGSFLSVDTAKRQCVLDTGVVPYDYLVFAHGAVSNFFGNDNLAKQCIPMKNLSDALAMRNALLKTIEKASAVKNVAEQTRLLNIVVAGGGPTGVEVAGMIGELRKGVFLKDYPELRCARARIYLVEGNARLLTGMSTQTDKDARKALEALGVEIKLSTRVLSYNEGKVLLSDGSEIETPSLIWAAGVTVLPVAGLPEDCRGRGGRLITDAWHAVAGVQNIYAIGDVSLQGHEAAYPGGHPQLAQVALQQGKNLAANFRAMAGGRQPRAFAYYNKGTMAIVGRKKAVVDLGHPQLHLKGFTAMQLWLFIHLMGLINYRNRVSTLINWAWAWFTRDLPLRMIVK